MSLDCCCCCSYCWGYCWPYYYYYCCWERLEFSWSIYYYYWLELSELWWVGGMVWGCELEFWNYYYYCNWSWEVVWKFGWNALLCCTSFVRRAVEFRVLLVVCSRIESSTWEEFGSNTVTTPQISHFIEFKISLRLRATILEAQGRQRLWSHWRARIWSTLWPHFEHSRAST